MAPKLRDGQEASGYLKRYCNLWKEGLRRFLKRSAGSPGRAGLIARPGERAGVVKATSPSRRQELKQEGRGKMDKPGGGLRTQIGSGSSLRFTQVRLTPPFPLPLPQEAGVRGGMAAAQDSHPPSPLAHSNGLFK